MKKLARLKKEVVIRSRQVNPAFWDLTHQAPVDQGRLAGEYLAYLDVLRMIEKLEGE